MERATLNRVIQVIAHDENDVQESQPFLALVGSFAALGAIRETAESFRLYAPLHPRHAADMATRALDEILKRYLTEHQGIENWRIDAWRDRDPEGFERLRASLRLPDDFQLELTSLANELRGTAAVSEATKRGVPRILSACA